MRFAKLREAETNLSTLIEQALNGEEIIIARGSLPSVRLVPVREVRGRRKPGALRGKLHVGREFFEPLPRDERTAWE